MGRHRIQRQTHQITTPNHKENRYHTPTGSKLVKTIANHHQQNLIGQQHRPIRNNKDTHEIQETIRNKSHYQERGGENKIKPGCYPIQQKARPIPYHLQDDVKNELDRIIKSGLLQRLETIEEDCFVSPVVIAVKKDKTVKIALDARKLNDSCIKKRPHMPNMDELLNQISSELSKNELDPIWISVIDLDYAYGQMKLSPETSKHCNFTITGEKINGYYRFLKGFYGPADIPTIFQEKIVRTLGHQIRVWLDDIIIATRGTKEQHTQNLKSVVTKLEDEGYKASKKKFNFYQKETVWLRHTISQDGIRPNKEKTDAINKLNPPTNTKTLKSFLGGIQYFVKFVPNLSEKTDNMRQLLKKRSKMGVDRRTKRRFQQHEKRTDNTTMPSTLQRQQRKHCHNRRM